MLAEGTAGTDGRALFALATAVSRRRGWRLEEATLAAEWTVAGGRAEALVSFYFGEGNPRGPSTVFSVHVKATTPGPGSRARLARSAGIRALRAGLGDGFRAQALPRRHALADQLSWMRVLRTADLGEVLRELERVAAAVGGATSAGATAALARSGRRTLFSVCRAVASSAGPWRLTSFSFGRRARTRREGTTWTVWKSLCASTSYQLQEKAPEPGILSMLGVSPADWTPETRFGPRPKFPRTERMLVRAGYRPMHGADDRAATFIRVTRGLRRRPAVRELDRLESASLS